MRQIFAVNQCEISVPENKNFTYSKRRLQVFKSTKFQHGFNQILSGMADHLSAVLVLFDGPSLIFASANLPWDITT